MRYQDVDRPPWLLSALWVDTERRWRGEGLAAGCSVAAHLGLPEVKLLCVGPPTGVFPQFEPTVLEEDETMVKAIDKNGIAYRREKNSSSMPEYTDYPIQSAADLEAFMESRFSLDAIEDRYTEDWRQRMERGSNPDREEITYVDGGCIYGWFRRLAGVATSSILLHEEPERVDRFIGRVHDIAMHGMERVFERTGADYLGFGEDIAFKSSTLISPDMFKRFLLPRYKAACDLAARHGVDIVWYDSDGHLFPFMDLYLEAGIRGFAPLEIAAGMDPVQIRRRYGNAVHMVGGFDKRILAGDKAGIEKEVRRLAPVIEEGGYIPACDHNVPPDVSLENYTFFIECLRRLYGVE